MFGLVYSASLGQTLRWDLAQQIALADSFLNTGHLYPDAVKDDVGSASVYFPGVAFLAIFIMKLGVSKFVFEILFAFACLLFIWLVYLLSKTSSIVSRNDLKQSSLFGIFFIFIIIFCNNFFLYSIEFKADTIAFCIGLSALIYVHNGGEKTSKKMFLWGVVFSLGLLFKQQFIAEVVAICLFTLLLDRTWKYFAVGCLIGSGLILIYFWQIPNLPFWTAAVLTNDGFLSPRIYAIANLPFYFAAIGSVALVYIVGFNQYYLIEKNSLIHTIISKFTDFVKTPFFWFLIAGAAAGLAGSTRVGGNSGNSEIALLLISPLFLGSLKWKLKLNFNILLIISIIFLIPKGLNSPAKYSQALSETRAVSELLINIENPKILFDSNLYFLVRNQTPHTHLTDYLSLAIKNDISPMLAIKELTQSAQFDLLLIKSNVATEQEIRSLESYSIVQTSGDYFALKPVAQ